MHTLKSNQSTAKVLQILIPNGNPNGLKIIGITGWSGKCFVLPRQSLRELKNQPEVQKPGLYILFGQEETTGEKLAYIGESESFFNRVNSHDSQKDFWSSAVIFTGELNRAYVKYLEHRATSVASKAKRMNIQNKVQPQENSLSDFDKVTVDQYFENVRFVLSALNYELFEAIEDSAADQPLYFLKGQGFDSSARLLENGDMLVLAGGTASIKESNSFNGWAKAARTRYLEEGRLRQKDEVSYELMEDTLFKSPSGAAATMAARSINGWRAWKDASGNTLDQNLRTD